MTNTHHEFLTAMAEANAKLAKPLPHACLVRMAEHWQLVCCWNRRVNLTAINDAATAAWLHYGDALTALPWMDQGLTLDVGSGGGFPGIVLALARPQQPFLLMEPRRKRAVLLNEAADTLGLPLVDVYKGRLADAPTALCAQVVTRATFSNLGDLAPASRWLRPGGRLIAYRSQASPLPQGELATLAAHGLHYETGHAYGLLDRARRLDIWISRGNVGDIKNEQSRG